MATWKKVIVSGSNISQLNNDANYLASSGQGIFSSSAQVDLDNVTEGATNLYFTDARVKTKMDADGVISSSAQVSLGNAQGTTDNVSEGSSNLYFTDARVKSKMNADGVISSSAQIDGDFLNTTGDNVISSSAQVDLSGVQGDTDDITEGSNLFYTDARVKTKLNTEGVISGSSQVNLGHLDTDDLSEGSNLYYTDARVKSKMDADGVISGSSQVALSGVTGTTDDVSEGSSNLYFTDARVKTKMDADGVISGSSQVDLGHLDTDDLSEGSNLYYTDARVKTKLNTEAVISGSIPSNNQGEITVNGNAVDLGLKSSATPTFAGLTISGDLTVNGATTTINTTNLEVEDRFIFLNEGSGSASPVGEGGIIVEGGTAGEGEALYREQASNRWAVAGGVAKDATSANADGFLSIVLTGNANSDSAIDGLVDNEYEAKGNIFIGDDQGIWIYS